MDLSEFLKQLAEAQVKNHLLEEKYSTAQYEAECLQKDLQRSQAEVTNLQRALEATQKEVFELKRGDFAGGTDTKAELRALQAESAATIEELREENQLARRRVVELETDLRLLRDSQRAPDNEFTEEFRKQLSQWRQRLNLRSTAEASEIFSAINNRLDIALMYETRNQEADFTQQELRSQLRESHASASELANRIEVLLAEKEAMKREASLWNTEKMDLMATKGLLEQRVTSLERQLDESRSKLLAESDALRALRLENQQIHLERNSQAVQLTALLESLAATLSTLENPCLATEAAVKEAVTRLTGNQHHLKNTVAQLENQVEQLGKQFEFQFSNGQTLCEELDALKGQLDAEKRLKERLQCEVEGFRLINCQRNLSPQHLEKVLRLSEKLGLVTVNRSHSELVDQISDKIIDLIDRGCLPSECVAGSLLSPKNPSKNTAKNGIHRHGHSPPSHEYNIPSADDCPSCVHLHTTPLDLANRAPDWGDLEERQVKRLCTQCLLCLATALKQRLRVALAPDPANEKRLRELTEALDRSKAEIEELHEQIMKTENDKREEYEKLEQMVSKLEALRQHQAKRIAGLQTKTERQSNLEAQKDQQLKDARHFLVENRAKQLRLLNFRNSLGRLLGIDAWLYQNPEALIIHRVQQIMLNASAQGRIPFLMPPSSQTYVPPGPALPPLSVPALTFPNDVSAEDGITNQTGSPARKEQGRANRERQRPASRPAQGKPTVAFRSQSARARDARKY